MTWHCQCGAPAFAIKPGSDAVFALPRDLYGNPDKQQKPIVIQQPAADVFRCLGCMPRKC